MSDSDWDDDHNSNCEIKKVAKKDVYIENSYRRKASFNDEKEEITVSKSRGENLWTEKNNENDVKSINIDLKYIGKIIGKGGANIKRLQQETCTRIFVNDNVCENMSRITIKGTCDNINEAISKINTITNENNQKPQLSSYRVAYGNQNTSKPFRLIDWDNLNKVSIELNKEKFGNLQEIIKVTYEEAERTDYISDEFINEFFEEHQITVKDRSDDENRIIPKPTFTFDEIFSKYPEILQSIQREKFTEPSPIQCLSWPIIMSGYDFIGIARTGTGKTLAFLLPALIHIEKQITPREERIGPTCLILSPTRELAQQIHEEVKKFNYKGIRSVCIYGGGSRKEQIITVEKGVEIVIATPGRLNDLIMNNIITLTTVTYLVLDEADRMLDLGFEPEIRKTLFDVRSDRQTIMTSATWPPGVTRLINNYMNKPIQVNIGALGLSACRSILQLVEFIDEDHKLTRIKDIISQMDSHSKFLIFVARKISADYLVSELTLSHVCSTPIQVIHGNREQVDREQAISDFKSGESRVLIATDVASRGLDIQDVTHVINYDFPKNIEEYVHRIGRTGRAGKFGTSVSFLTRNSSGSAQALIDVLTEAQQHVPDELIIMAESHSQRMREREFNNHSNSRKRTCYKCGKSDHLSYNCTNS